MSRTRPTSDQVRFESSRNGTLILDTYLEAAEKGGRTLGDLLSDLFDDNGNLRPFVEFRESAPGVFQYRLGDFVDPDAGWQDAGLEPFPLPQPPNRVLGTDGNAARVWRVAIAEYDPTLTYRKGDVVVRDGELLRSRVDAPVAPFDPQEWEPATPHGQWPRVQAAYARTLVYTAPADPLDLAVGDDNGDSYVLDSTLREPVDVHVDGLRLVEGRDYTVDAQNNKIVFTQPPLGVAQVDVLVPAGRLAPGGVTNYPLAPIVANGGARYPMTRADTGQPVTVGRAAEVAYYVDGVRQRPDVDYQVVGTEVVFTQAPPDDAVIWGMWYAPGGTSTGGQGVSRPDPALAGIVRDFQWVPGQDMGWSDARGNVRLVPDRAARLALRYPEDVDTGTLVVQQDTGWTYLFRPSSQVKRPPAVTLRYGPTAPTATNPVNPIDFIFTGLPAAEETTFVNHSVLYDSNTKQTHTSDFQFTIPAGGGLKEALDAITNALPPRGLSEVPPDTVRDQLPPNLSVMDAFITAWSPPDPNAPITDANWLVFSDHITLPDWNAINALEAAGEVREGMTVGLPADEKVYIYLHGAWQEMFAVNNFPHQLRALSYDPEQPVNDRLEWRDARAQLTMVQTTAELSSIPTSHLVLGKLVLVKSEATLYQLIADPEQGNMSGTLDDWQPMVNGVTFVGRVGGLPNPATDNVVDGQVFVVKMDNAGEDLLRLVVFDDNMPGKPSAPAVNITITVTPQGNPDQPTNIDFDDAGGTPSNYERTVDYDITTSQGQFQGQLKVPAGSKAHQFAVALRDELNGLAGVPFVASIPAGQGSVVTVTPNGGETAAPVLVTIDAPVIPPAAAAGGYRFLNRQIWTKDLRTDPDQATDQHEGDVQITVEKDHAELKVFVNGGWDLVHSDDEISAKIASLSLFEGTVKDPGNHDPNTAGAIELDRLPNLWPMEQLNDLSKVSHYYTYVGTPGYEVTDGAGQEAAATAAHKNFGEITVTTVPATLPAAAGANIEMHFAVGGNGQVEVDKFIAIQIALTDDQGVKQAYEVRQNINTAGGMIPMNAEKLASQGSSQWNQFAADAGLRRAYPGSGLPDDPALDPATELFFTHAAGDAFFTINIPDGWMFQIFDSQDGGTPAVGESLAGTQMQVGDWIQIANQGGDGTGQGLNGGPPKLVYVRVGGNLLTKGRGDDLYGLYEWTAPGTWEQGSLVTYAGDVYRAATPIDPSVGDPKGTPDDITIPTTGATIETALDGSGAAGLPDLATAANGEIQRATADGVHARNAAFSLQTYQAGDVFVFSSNPRLAGTGNTVEGYPFDKGWVYVGNHPGALPDPVHFQAASTTSPWQRVDISGGLKIANTDADLPGSAPAGQVWIVVDSAQAGGGQALYGYDMGAGQWVELGGGDQSALTLDGGAELLNYGMPVGGIVAYAGAQIPTGWLLCNGGMFSEVKYPELFAVLGQRNRTPDLVDQFIRGAQVADPYTTHNDSTKMPNAGFAVSGGSHHHPMRWHAANTDSSWAWSSPVFALNDAQNPQNQSFTKNTGDDGGHTHTISGGDPETLPKHVKLCYIIKACDEGVTEKVP